MRYLTHQFANVQTLDRARRWLVHAGIDPSQIETITTGVPRIAVRLAPGQAAEVSLVIDAAELSDPQGFPSFWDLARQPHFHTGRDPEPKTLIPELKEPRGFVVGYHLSDERPYLEADLTASDLWNAFLGRQSA